MTGNKTQVPNPLVLTAATLSGIAAGFLVVGGLALPSLVYFSQLNPDILSFGVIATITYAIAASQNVLGRDTDEDQDLSTAMWVIATALSIIHYNAVVWVAAIIGMSLTTSATPVIALIAVLVYVFWDIETRSRGIPLSVGGVIVFLTAIGILLHRGGKAVFTKLKRSSFRDIFAVLINTSPLAVTILDSIEQVPVRQVKRFSR